MNSFSAKQLADKIKEFESFAERIKDMYNDLELEILEIGQTGVQKEIQQAETKYGKMLDDAKKYTVTLEEIEIARYNELKDKSGSLEIAAINEKYDKLRDAAKQQGALINQIEVAKTMKILVMWRRHHAEMKQLQDEAMLDYEATR